MAEALVHPTGAEQTREVPSQTQFVGQGTSSDLDELIEIWYPLSLVQQQDILNLARKANEFL